MTKGQKVILVFAVLAYMGVLFSFFIGHNVLLLIFVVASAVLLISYNLAGGAELDNLEMEKNEEINKLNLELKQVKINVDEMNVKLNDKDHALSETMKLYKDAQLMAKDAKAAELLAKEECEQVKLEADEKKKRAVKEAVEEALAKAKLSVDDKSFAGMDALIPNISNEKEIVNKINLVSLTSDTAAEFSEFADKAGIAIKVNSSQTELSFMGDPERIRIMLRNIIDNSIKYMKKEGSLIITLSKVGDEAFIVLKDNGEGLNENETKHIFELNFQGSNRISGNGLGLTQAKAIADKYNGHMYARSDSGKGMGIYISLPLLKEESKNEDAKES